MTSAAAGGQPDLTSLLESIGLAEAERLTRTMSAQRRAGLSARSAEFRISDHLQAPYPEQIQSLRQALLFPEEESSC